ncbi:tonalli isoform b [Anaeramoeba flamelloides]|uniref:Tonalli isoform b n=1 Tax=Anaeramoeba flamelloides TaxID=1746091 RepID=A0AAV7ZTU8_9EUKA|nr:tonalli isoform b [Anaeramoeba flamelloides]
MIYLDDNEQNSRTGTSSRRSVPTITTTTTTTTNNNVDVNAKTVSPSGYFDKILNYKIKNIQNQKKRVLFTKLTLMYSKQKKISSRIIYKILFGNSLLLRPYWPPSIGPIFLTHEKNFRVKLFKESITQMKKITTQKNCSVYFRCFCHASLQQLNIQNLKKINVQISVCEKKFNLSPNKPIKMDLNWFNNKTNEITFSVTKTFSKNCMIMIVFQPMVYISIEDLTKKIVSNRTLNKTEAITLMQKNQFGFKIDEKRETTQTNLKQTTSMKQTAIINNISNTNIHKDNSNTHINNNKIDQKIYQNNLKLNLNLNSNQRNFNMKKVNNRNSTNNDISINFLSDTISLKCPLSRKRIKIPSRTIKCKHLQCFDLTQFIKFAEFSKKWVCPCCNIKIKLNELIIDGFFQEIISMCNKTHEEVTVFPDGNWSLGKIEVNTQKPKPKQVDIVIDPEIEDFQDLYDILNPNNSQFTFSINEQQNNSNFIDNNNSSSNNNNDNNNFNITDNNHNNTLNNSSANNFNTNDFNNTNYNNNQLETNSFNFPQISSLPTNFNILTNNKDNSNIIIRKRQLPQQLQTPKNQQTHQTEQIEDDHGNNNNQNTFNLTNTNFDFGFFENNNNINNSNSNINNNNNSNSNKIRRTLTTQPNIFFCNVDNQFSQQSSLNFSDQTLSELQNFNFNTNLNSFYSQNNQSPNTNQGLSDNQLFFD